MRLFCLSVWAVLGASRSIPEAHKSLAILLGENEQADPTEIIRPWLESVKSVSLHKGRDPGVLTADGGKVDNLLLIGSRLPDDVSNGDFTEFAKRGGNILWIIEDDEVDYRARALAAEFGRDLKAKLPQLKDFHNAKSTLRRSDETADRVFPQSEYIFKENLASVHAHRMNPLNPLVFPLLHGTAESVSVCSQSPSSDICSPSLGTENTVASALETRTGARIVIVTASLKFLSSNKALLQTLLDWSFDESGQLKLDSLKHEPLQDRKDGRGYRINDLIEIRICLSTKTLHQALWSSIQPHDLQVELSMLDPWLRADFTPTDRGCLSSGPLRLPDRYGVYTLKLQYQRRGWSHIIHEERLIVRPLYHDEVAGFVVAALPYYLSWISVMVASFFAVYLLVFPGPNAVPKTQGL